MEEEVKGGVWKEGDRQRRWVGLVKKKIPRLYGPIVSSLLVSRGCIVLIFILLIKVQMKL